ncbi:MAG: hypothetical protein L3J35_01250 [Bacteroidales bacterium]|nr:hypothetical protein [Bacteroidales bacterium]
MNIDDKNKTVGALNEIFENPDFSESQFISDIQDVIDNLTMEDLEPDSGFDGDGEY